MSSSLLRNREYTAWSFGWQGMVVSVLLAFILLAVSAVGAQTFEEASAEYNRGDYAVAFESFRTFAEQGDARAQFVLGTMYADGKGVPQDDAEAVRWYRRAAEQGDARAQVSLGYMYVQGRGVSQDYTEALRWFRQAAEQGDARAQIKLGAMYALGQGVPQDHVQAHKWFNLAASRFSSSEQELRDKAVQARNGVASLMTPAQLAEAQRLMREWQPGE